MKRNRFIRLSGGTKTVNRELEEKARALAGIKGYVTNLRACPDGTPVTAEFVIGAYHQLYEFERSFRMAQNDLQARPIYHHLRDLIEAHLTIVLAARIHRMLGERQEQMLPMLAEAGEHGATSGDIARALEYDQPNAMITLNAMVRAGLLLKDESAVPYRFRLVPELLTGTDAADGGPGRR